MPSEIGFAIIGAGYIAQTHAKALAALPGVRVCAVHSVIAQEAQSLAATYNAVASTDLRAVLERKDVQAVCICTPSSLHPEHAIAALNAGKDVLVEKPIATRLADALAMVQAADRNQRILATILQRRFMPAIRYVRDAVASGRLGRLVSGQASVCWYRTPRYYAASNWRGTWAMDGGGALMNQAIHYADLLLWMFGEPRTVAAQSATLLHTIEVEDTLVASIRFGSGAMATLNATTAAFPGLHERLQVCGTHGSAILEDGCLRYKYFGAEDGLEVPDYGLPAEAGVRLAQGVRLEGPDAHQAQIADFVAAIRDRRPPAVDGREACRSLALVEAIYAAARSGSVVTVTPPAT
jgi:predicted dehydrogenase